MRTTLIDLVDHLYTMFEHLGEEEKDEETLPVSDDAEYAEELQFQEALIFSSIASQPIIRNNKSLERTAEAGESSRQSYCQICLERKEGDQMFRIPSCFHLFCSECIAKYVKIKAEEGISLIMCPELNCKSILDLDVCRPMLPKEVVDRWEDALCEELIRGTQKLYCPFKDCSAVLVIDNEGETIRESECPFCHRLFCANCNVPWHSGIGCEEYEKLNKDEKEKEDLMVRELARKKNWIRCPQCKFYVERTGGCLHMTCRCKFEFCYGCGAEWTDNHAGCQNE